MIKSSNLCTEILEFTSPDEIAVCNLASIALNMFVSRPTDGSTPVFDFQRLLEITKVATRNLNKVIDVNFYPVPEARNSNMRHRPIGLGVQGMADCLALMRMPFESDEAQALNKEIFETLYYAAMWASCELAEVEGHYESYPGSPLSKGLMQPDLWGVKPTARWDWDALRARVAKHGARNSLLLAPMPTASTAQILGNNESIEPFTSNIYTRRVLAGEFPMVNRHLLKDLIERGLWTPQMRLMVRAASGDHTDSESVSVCFAAGSASPFHYRAASHHRPQPLFLCSPCLSLSRPSQIISDKGSVQRVPSIPDDIKELYKTVWVSALTAARVGSRCRSGLDSAHGDWSPPR